jgi:hypothetical protein
MIYKVVKRATTSGAASHQSIIDTHHFSWSTDRVQIDGVGYQSFSTFHASSNVRLAADIRAQSR